MNIISLERRDFFLVLNTLFVFVNLSLFFISSVMLNGFSFYVFLVALLFFFLIFPINFINSGKYLLDFNLFNMFFLSFNFFVFSLGILSIENFYIKFLYFTIFLIAMFFSCIVLVKSKKEILECFLLFTKNLIKEDQDLKVLNLIEWNFDKNDFLMKNKINTALYLIVFFAIGVIFFIFCSFKYQMNLNIFSAFWAWSISYTLSIFIAFNLYKAYLSSLVFKKIFNS